MDGLEKNENEESVKQERQEIFSEAVRAGKRTYFFDVKSTRRNDYYLTITESKKRFNKDGRYFFEKHKIFLYKEDFDKFVEGLESVIDFIKNSNVQPIEDIQEETVDSEVKEEKSETKEEETIAEEFTQVEFDDLNEQ